MAAATKKARPSDITPVVYRTASQEHATAALLLFEHRQYVLAHYVAGLGVECIIRAYRTKLAAPFDERHDLYELARAARFFDLFPSARVRALSAAFGTVAAQWVNTHRFRSESALRKFLTERKLYMGVKGDLLHARTRLIVNAAFELVTMGVTQWQP